MKQRTIARILMAGGIVAAIGIILVFGVFVPIVANECRTMYPEFAYLYWPGLIGMWLIGALFLLGLWEYFRVCVRIGGDRSFSVGNVTSLRRIAVYMAASGLLWIGAAFGPGVIFHADIGPVWIYLFLFAMAGFALALLAWGLSLLLQRAVEIQEENDLTV